MNVKFWTSFFLHCLGWDLTFFSTVACVVCTQYFNGCPLTYNTRPSLADKLSTESACSCPLATSTSDFLWNPTKKRRKSLGKNVLGYLTDVSYHPFLCKLLLLWSISFLKPPKKGVWKFKPVISGQQHRQLKTYPRDSVSQTNTVIESKLGIRAIKERWSN